MLTIPLTTALVTKLEKLVAEIIIIWIHKNYIQSSHPVWRTLYLHNFMRSLNAFKPITIGGGEGGGFHPANSCDFLNNWKTAGIKIYLLFQFYVGKQILLKYFFDASGRVEGGQNADRCFKKKSEMVNWFFI